MLSKWAKFHSTNRSNVYNSQARRQDFAAQGCKNHNGGHFFQIQYWMHAATATTVACNMSTLFTFTSTHKVIQIWTPNRPSAVICFFATWTRKDTRNSIFCKSLKLLSPGRLFLRFTFAPASSFMSHKPQYIGSLYSTNQANRPGVLKLSWTGASCKGLWRILNTSWHLDYAISRQSCLVKASARGTQRTAPWPQGGPMAPFEKPWGNWGTKAEIMTSSKPLNLMR